MHHLDDRAGGERCLVAATAEHVSATDVAGRVILVVRPSALEVGGAVGHRAQPRPGRHALVDGELLAESEALKGELAVAAEEEGEEME